MVENAVHTPLLKKWIIAARPWSLPASTMPVIFGTSLAVVIAGARLRPFRFLLALAGMVILHSAANMLSDVFDYKRGLDKDVTPVSGAIVRGWLSAQSVAVGAAVLFVLGTAIGLVLAWLTGPGSAHRRRGGHRHRPFLFGAQVSCSRRLGGFLELRAARVAGGVGRPDPFFFLAARHLDGSHGHAGHRHPPCQQLAGYHHRQGAKSQNDGLPSRRQRLALLLRLSALRVDGHHLRPDFDPAIPFSLANSNASDLFRGLAGFAAGAPALAPGGSPARASPAHGFYHPGRSYGQLQPPLRDSLHSRSLASVSAPVALRGGPWPLPTPAVCSY